MTRLSPLIVLFSCVTSCAQEPKTEPHTLWFDPVRGHHDAAGTEAAPLRTLAEAVSRVEALPKGSRVALLDGLHGAVRLRADGITIESVGGAKPTLARLEIDGSDVVVRGLTISPAFASERLDGPIVCVGERRAAERVTIEGCFIYGTLDASTWTVADWRAAKTAMHMGRRGRELTFRDNFVLNVRFGLQLDAPDSTAAGNVVSGFSADGIRITRDGVRVAHNVIKNCYLGEEHGDRNHDDAIQCFLFNKGSGTVRDVAVIGNVILAREHDDQPFASSCQGIGFFDGPLVDFEVTDNVVVVDHWHGVALYDAQTCHLTGNTCYSPWPSKRKPWLRLGQKKNLAKHNTVTNNCAHSFSLSDDPEVITEQNERIDSTMFQSRFRVAVERIHAAYGERHALAGRRRVSVDAVGSRPPK